MGKQLRNTTIDRICPHCEGTGAIEKNDSAYGDPQQEYFVNCGHPGCIDGWIRFAPIDPLEKLKQARQHARSSWGALKYGRLRMEAMSPVDLPGKPLPVDRLISNVERARDAFRWAA